MASTPTNTSNSGTNQHERSGSSNSTGNNGGLHVTPTPAAMGKSDKCLYLTGLPASWPSSEGGGTGETLHETNLTAWVEDAFSGVNVRPIKVILLKGRTHSDTREALIELAHKEDAQMAMGALQGENEHPASHDAETLMPVLITAPHYF
eukprot:TCALIF_05985-PA protein Name:"Protein of unknown function" AED:0.55 eAED:1.00 QI:0/-1/0/1/-1/1/1/0/148